MTDPPSDPTRRYGDRVEHYARHRPSYPRELLELFRTRLRLTDAHIVADVGSGTGILSKLFLDNGNTVHGIEPNPEMAAAAESAFAGFPRFHGVRGRAEATGLASASVDLVVAGQAFHWFDAEATRCEFRRILKAGGAVALVWNSRRTEGTPFLAAYEAFLHRWGNDYAAISRRYRDSRSLERFFAPEGYEEYSFPNAQVLDFEGLRGRLLSSSYSPAPNDPRHEPMLAALGALFATHHHEGRVCLEYETEVCLAEWQNP